MYKNVLDYFSETADRFPDKIAVIHNDGRITFKVLQQKSIGLASCLLKEYNIGRNVPIAVFLPKSIDVVVSDLAIAYMGCFFSNLDVQTPMERIGNILTVMKPVMLITDSEHIDLLHSCGESLIVINIDNFKYQECVSENPRIGEGLDMQIDTDPFCIINTSGSTGTPKGVVLNHRSFFDFLNWATETFDFDHNTVIGSLSPVVFDIYDFEWLFMGNSG